MQHAWRKLLPLALFALVAALSLPLVFGFLGRLHPALDSFTHFRLHLAAVMGVAAMLLAFTRFRREATMALLLAGGAFLATPGTMPNALLTGQAVADDVDDTRPAYRLLHFNARFDNPQPDLFLSMVGRLRPDVITVNEVSTRWRIRLETLAAAYPHSVYCRQRGNGRSVAILSRRPFVAGSTPACHIGSALATAEIDFGGTHATVGALHLLWPWPFDQPAQQRALAPLLAALPSETIIAGDFNAVRWSNTVRGIAAAGRLRDAGPVGPSWAPAKTPETLRRALGLGIDHVLVGEGVEPRAVERQADAGSDHLPVLMEFSLPPPRRPTVDVAAARAGAGLN